VAFGSATNTTEWEGVSLWRSTAANLMARRHRKFFGIVHKLVPDQISCSSIFQLLTILPLSCSLIFEQQFRIVAAFGVGVSQCQL